MARATDAKIADTRAPATTLHAICSQKSMLKLDRENHRRVGAGSEKPSLRHRKDAGIAENEPHAIDHYCTYERNSRQIEITMQRQPVGRQRACDQQPDEPDLRARRPAVPARWS